MRTILLIAGCVTLFLMWGLLPAVAPTAFYVHMTMHMGVVAVAAPLLAIGMAGGRLDPVIKAPRFFAPVPISLLELVVVWMWHAPALHHFARHSVLGVFVEQSMFLLCGLLLWLSAFGGSSPQDPDRAAAGVIGLLLTMMHMVLLGALLALTPRVLYVHDAAHETMHGTSHTGLSPLEDQHLGGAIMLVGGGVSYLAGGLWLSVGLLREKTIQSRVTR